MVLPEVPTKHRQIQSISIQQFYLWVHGPRLQPRLFPSFSTWTRMKQCPALQPTLKASGWFSRNIARVVISLWDFTFKEAVIKLLLYSSFGMLLVLADNQIQIPGKRKLHMPPHERAPSHDNLKCAYSFLFMLLVIFPFLPRNKN